MAVPATVTVTVTAADTAPSAVATTRTVCAMPSSGTIVTSDGVLCPSSKLNLMSSSASSSTRLVACTSQSTEPPSAVPENRMVSSPSAGNASDAGVIVKAADRPTVSPLLMVTVAVPDEAE